MIFSCFYFERTSDLISTLGVSIFYTSRWRHMPAVKCLKTVIVLYLKPIPVDFCNERLRHDGTKVLALFCRYRKLAEHYKRMYPKLNINIEEELEQLKVRKQPCPSHWTQGCCSSDGVVFFFSFVLKVKHNLDLHKSCGFFLKRLRKLFFSCRDLQRDCVLWSPMACTSCTKLWPDPVRRSWWRGPTLLSWISTLVRTRMFCWSG